MTNTDQPTRPGPKNLPGSGGTEQEWLHHYEDWERQRIAEGKIEQRTRYAKLDRCAFFEDWMSWLITRGSLQPHKRLPPYEQLAALPFQLEKQDIALIIRQLRAEGVLPTRKTRKDAGIPQWTQRDEYCWEYIGHMRALRFDQVRRLLARQSTHAVEGGSLSLSRTSEIVDRWVLEKLAVYRHVYHAQPGWIHLTRKGVRLVGLDFRAEQPSHRSLHHLYWVTEVRMHLEEEYGEMRWISERSIQAEQEQRRRGQRLQHIPDGILLLRDSDGAWAEIDIEVQTSKPSPDEIQAVMSDQLWTGARNRPLRYYVNRLSRGVVRAVYKKMLQEQKALRPSIEIIDLELWQPLPLEAR